MRGFRGSLAVLGVVLIGAIGAVGCSTESDESQAETPAGASTAVNSAVQTDSKGKTIATEPSTSTGEAPDPAAAGAEVFAEGCEGCHPDGGKGAGAGPQLAGVGLAEARITTQITNGGGGMPGFGETLSAEDLENVITYVKSIQ